MTISDDLDIGNLSDNNIPDDVVGTIFEFCKAFNEVQKNEFSLILIY